MYEVTCDTETIVFGRLNDRSRVANNGAYSRGIGSEEIAVLHWTVKVVVSILYCRKLTATGFG